MNDGGPTKWNCADFAQLLAAARSGDRTAVGALLQAHGDYLRSVAEYSLDADLRAKESASDLIQKTFLEAHRDIGQFCGATEPEFRTWLTRILDNNVADLARRYRQTQKRAIASEVASCDKSALDGKVRSPSSLVRRDERDDQLRQAIARLPENYRHAIELRHRENLDFAEIGARLGVSGEAARKLWTRAIERLRSELKNDDSS